MTEKSTKKHIHYFSCHHSASILKIQRPKTHCFCDTHLADKILTFPPPHAEEWNVDHRAEPKETTANPMQGRFLKAQSEIWIAC